MPVRKRYKYFSGDPSPIVRDPRAPTGPNGPNDPLMATSYRVELNTCYNTNAEKTYKNVYTEDQKDRERRQLMTNLESLQRNAVACEGKRFLREQIGHRRLRQQLCQELQQDDRALLEVRQARMAELVIAERKQADAELAQRGLAIYEQRI
ncbi:uncharacterized protein LOC122366265 [Amphibalanus amphitrite]|uniref:uncharacterized protein LOC122366265 n=1 Tax=Amphibalanus amphitrite TaxID=1232801 RepID=UPI001C902BA1|nr:uncharacterized protein LOC122366265 [Amphibalanus amphitrite]